MTSLILLAAMIVLVCGLYYRLARRYRYDPGLDFAIGVRTGDYKLAATKFLELFIINGLIVLLVRYSLLAVLELALAIANLFE